MLKDTYTDTMLTILQSKKDVSDVKKVTRGVREAYFTFHEY
jgi:hypothetical protein